VYGINSFTAKDNMLKGISIGLVRVRHRPKLYEITISAKEIELSKLIKSIWLRA
jgi:hypothetical protein